MEPHQQYALYDGGASGTKQWVAHVRLTPELLQRLQQKPQSVSIQLQAPGSTSSGASSRSTRTTSASTKVNTVLSVHGGDGEETDQYELLSFVEDPKVNVVCAFRKDPTVSKATTATSDEESKATEPVGDGYSLYEVGRVYQKLIVQRKLDSTEKDRMKDRHAKSVLESKSRASKLLKDEDVKPTRSSGRTKSLSTMSVALPPGVTPGSRARAAAEVITQVKRRKLASALTPEAVQELQDRISKGGGDEDVEMGTEEETVIFPRARNTIFSSDSELEKSPTLQPQPTPVVAEAKETARKPKPAKKASAKRETKPTATPVIENESKSDAKERESTNEAQAKELHAEVPPAEDKPVGSAEVAQEALPPNDVVSSATVKAPAPYMLKSAKRTGPLLVKRVRGDTADVKKRARPRLSRLPDISFLPQEIQDICKHVSSHITRTAILDADDHESFTAEYERFRNEWEQLDKAYSIESILLDGAHFQLPFATTDEEKQTLRARIDGADKKKEGLLFLRESMGTIHKILSSLQASIAAYEQRTAAAVSST